MSDSAASATEAEPDRDARSIERKHYVAIRYLAQTRYDAINYLYGRLNIIDAKSSTLLNVNGLLLATTTFLLGALVHTDGTRVHLAVTICDYLTLFLVSATILIVVLLAISTGYCFRIFSLKFDHVTRFKSLHPNGSAKNNTLEGAIAKPNASDLASLLIHSKRAGYGTGSSTTFCEEHAAGTLTHYEEDFFGITIERQLLLKKAWVLSAVAGSTVVVAFVGFALILIIQRVFFPSF